MEKKLAVISFDVEQDCPPYLETTRGMDEGMPRILDLLAEKKVKATFFFTGEMARRYHSIARRVVDEGHELGCHGFRHERFDKLSPEDAARAMEKATAILRSIDEDTASFRAPNLQRPRWMLDILSKLGYRVDSSIARYKPPFPRQSPWLENGIAIVPVSVTSSVLRLPWRLQALIHRLLETPVYFSHPWEYVDMSRAPVRLDCKFNTGDKALHLLGRLIDELKQRGYRIVPIRDYALHLTRAS